MDMYNEEESDTATSSQNKHSRTNEAKGTTDTADNVVKNEPMHETKKRGHSSELSPEGHDA